MTTQQTLSHLTHLIVDMDGVLYRGREAIPGADAFIGSLRKWGIGFVLATNNSTRTPQQYVDKLADMGITVYPHEVLTSALATADYLQGVAPPGARVFVIGRDGLRTALQEAGFILVEEEAEYVVVGMDTDLCYERLAEATLQIRAGAAFIGTNPDKTFPSERGIVPGNGATLAFLEAATGVAPTVIGKPEAAMIKQALARLGAKAATTAIVGDRLETDILAGRRNGLHTILVLSGITDREMLAQSDLRPDWVFESVGDLVDNWSSAVDR